MGHYAGFGDMNTDCGGPCVCPAQQALFKEAMRLYPRGPADPNHFAYILSKGAGFAGNWADWCAQQGSGGGVILGGGAQAQAQPGPAPYVAPTTAGMTYGGGGMSSTWLWVGAAVLIGGGLALVMRKKKSAPAAA